MTDSISFPTVSLGRIGIYPDPARFSNLKPPLIMGILNVTPDSFSDGGMYLDSDAAVERGLKMVSEGADIIDVGGESTRPFSEIVPPEVEIERVLPVIRELVRKIPVPVSIDTRNPETASECIGAGASMVNDVNGLREEGMDELVARTGVSAVIMHMMGSPKDMQVSPRYEDVVAVVRDFLDERVERMTDLGVDRGRLIVDPGIGFGKTVEHNLDLIANIKVLKQIGCPVLIGASRKSFIGKILGTETDERLAGSLAAALESVRRGADIVRVHDVLETKRALMITYALENPGLFESL
ncbi:MAG: dihydropteroate synthase [Thermoplasmatota archaeon]